jgi:hypothetical protein
LRLTPSTKVYNVERTITILGCQGKDGGVGKLGRLDDALAVLRDEPGRGGRFLGTELEGLS